MTLLAYSFASGITLIILTAVYWIMLRNTTHFVLNRICMMSILAASLLLPFVSLPSLSAIRAVPIEVGDMTLSSVASEVTVSHRSVDILKTIGLIYLIGVAVISLRYIINLIFIIYLQSISRKKVFGGLTLRVHTRTNIPPMSWGGEIFIQESVINGNSDELEMILAHENVHRTRHHWLDLLLSNIVTAINWYNPAAWLMQRELIAVHEYEADHIASGQCDNLTQYQLLLIKKTADSRFQAFGDSLNHSSLKKRITMMTKNQSKRSTRLYSLALVPAMALAFVASNSSCVNSAQQEVSATHLVKHAVETEDDNYKGNTFEAEEMVVVAYGDGKENEAKKVPEIATPPQYVGGEAAMYKKLSEVINFVGDVNETGRIIVAFTIDAEGKMVNSYIVKGLSEAKNDEAIRAVKQLTDWEPALTKDGKKVACDYTLPITLKTTPVKK